LVGLVGLIAPGLIVLIAPVALIALVGWPA
jgi:hypothetical protein